MNSGKRSSSTQVTAAAPAQAGKPSELSNAATPRQPNTRSGLDVFIDQVIAFFTSLRLTVVLLALGLVLIFLGTIAQVELGLYKAQNEYFRSFFIYWGPKAADLEDSRFSRAATWSVGSC